MLQRSLGPDAPSVSAVGFGGMPLSVERPDEKRPDPPEAIAVLHAVLDAGVTLIDTADAYSLDDADIGHNERLIAAALQSWSGDRARVVVATKGSMVPVRRHDWGVEWGRDGRPEHLRAACDRSLVALGVDRIDLYQLHMPDPAVPIEDSVGALAELRDAGKIRWLGLCNVDVRQVQRARKVAAIQTVQNCLSPFVRTSLRKTLLRPSVVGYCGKHGLGFLAYSPVGGGRLNKRLPEHPVLRPLAERHGVSAHAVALAWVRAQGPTVIPIPAARRAEHALDSAASLGVELTAGELAAIDRAAFPTD